MVVAASVVVVADDTRCLLRAADETDVLDWQLGSMRCWKMLHDDAPPSPELSLGVLDGAAVKWWVLLLLLLLLLLLAEHPISSGEQSDDESGDTVGSRFDDDADDEGERCEWCDDIPDDSDEGPPRPCHIMNDRRQI